MEVASPLEAWADFYLIVGSSAGALTGLQFVVMTLIAERAPAPNRGESISAFGTPNVVHFCAALLVGSILCIPWGTLRPAGIAVAACGGLGVLYSAIVMKRALRQREYQPVFEDWLWHIILPALAYATMLVAGLLLARNLANALFCIGPATLLLVFIGIHNAWDTVTYLTLGGQLREQEIPRGPGPAGPSGPTPPAQG
jgi:hypothetical protein